MTNQKNNKSKWADKDNWLLKMKDLYISILDE